MNFYLKVHLKYQLALLKKNTCLKRGEILKESIRVSEHNELLRPLNSLIYSYYVYLRMTHTMISQSQIHRSVSQEDC